MQYFLQSCSLISCYNLSYFLHKFISFGTKEDAQLVVNLDVAEDLYIVLKKLRCVCAETPKKHAKGNPHFLGARTPYKPKC